MTWQLGILTDRAGHVHLGAVVAGSASRARDYIELLAPIGAVQPAELDLEQLVVVVRGEQLADLRRLVEQCLDDDRLRQRLTELIGLSASPARRAGVGSLSSGAAGWSGTAPPTTGSARRGSGDAAPCMAEASGDPVGEGASSGPGVVCGEPTPQLVRLLGWITDPIWCCQDHDDRAIVRAWVHQLRAWHQLQAAGPSECRTCEGPCHCAAAAPDAQRPADGHRLQQRDHPAGAPARSGHEARQLQDEDLQRLDEDGAGEQGRPVARPALGLGQHPAQHR